MDSDSSASEVASGLRQVVLTRKTGTSIGTERGRLHIPLSGDSGWLTVRRAKAQRRFCLPCTLVGLSIPCCELFGGRCRFEITVHPLRPIQIVASKSHPRRYNFREAVHQEIQSHANSIVIGIGHDHSVALKSDVPGSAAQITRRSSPSSISEYSG